MIDFETTKRFLRQSIGFHTKSRATTEDVDRIAFATMASRLEQMGEKDSGAYNYYAKRLRMENRIIVPLELAIRDWVLANDPNCDRVHDIGAGIGSLALSFAVVGIQALAIERDKRRLAAMEAIKAQVGAQYPSIAKKLVTLGSQFPSSDIDAYRPEGAIAIMTNFNGTFNASAQNEIIHGLKKYKYVIIWAQSFCVPRQTDREYKELVDSFMNCGFCSSHKIIDEEGVGVFYKFSIKADK